MVPQWDDIKRRLEPLKGFPCGPIAANTKIRDQSPVDRHLRERVKRNTRACSWEVSVQNEAASHFAGNTVIVLVPPPAGVPAFCPSVYMSPTCTS